MQYAALLNLRSSSRKLDAERGALVGLAFDADVAAEGLGEVLDDGEAEAGAAELAGAGFIDAVEPLEDAGEVLLGDADAGVGDLERQAG